MTAAARGGGRAMGSSGTVHLVGAGPGDPGLLTLRGAELLRRADVVVHDRLAPPELLDLCPPWTERVDAGKAPGRAVMSQASINRLLVHRARSGFEVVRLKGGDPFVFGRGGEEALACLEAGVPFEVVPGVTSAVAAPAAAGIPLTHRGLASAVTIVTASGAGGAIDLAASARVPGTLVVLMAAARLAEACRAIERGGRPPDEPAAIVQWATTPRQRAVTGTLRGLPALAAAAGIGPPATLVVGEVAALSARLGPLGPGLVGVAAAAGPRDPPAEERRR